VGTRRIRLGQRGEQEVAEWYLARGYAVVARNWRCPLGEIDLICTRSEGPRGTTLVVCEVKSRTSTSCGHPLEAVTPAKQRRLRRLAAAYLRSQRHRYADVRFDVAGWLGQAIEVVEGAF
jgi:putative endonuclease